MTLRRRAVSLTVLGLTVLVWQLVRPPQASADPVFPPEELLDFDNPSGAAILRHEVEAELDPAGNRLRASDRLFVRHQPGIPASQPFPFLLWSDLQIESLECPTHVVRFERRERLRPRDFWKRPPYEQLADFERASQILVYLDVARAAAGARGSGAEAPGTWPEVIELDLRYSGTIMDSLRAPVSSYARSFETTAGLISEQGAYLAGASFWVPYRPGEVVTFQVRAAVPAGWRAVSQGTPVAEAAPAGAGRRLDIWDCPHPMEEIYLVAGPWELHERDHGGVAVQTYTYAQTPASVYERYLDGTGRYLDLYHDLIGRYPFGKFALVENFWQTGFGMPSFTLLGDRVIRLPFILDTSYGHEILHNWWGNGVFVDTEEGNWCEGLTTYGADYLYKERESAAAARQYRLTALTGYLDYVSGGEDIPLSAFRARHDFATQAVGYSKSMMVLHELRRRVGGEAFWEGLRTFYGRFLWRRASWSDLLGVYAGQDGFRPETFLEQWINRPGAPALVLREASAHREKDGRHRVRAVLAQEIEPATTSRPGNGPASGSAGQMSRLAEREADGFYDLRVPVRITWQPAAEPPSENEAGAPDSTWIVSLNSATATLDVDLPGRPLSLEVDPDFDLMRRIDRREIPVTLSRILGSDTVLVVLARDLSPELAAAYRELAAEWDEGQQLTVLEEEDLPVEWIPDHATWYFGWGTAARRLAGSLPEVELAGTQEAMGKRSAATIAGTTYDEGLVVLAGAFPGSSGDAAWALIGVDHPADVAVIGSKVPHYGKYSYLVFQDGKNIGQGIWTGASSPLVRRFD